MAQSWTARAIIRAAIQRIPSPRRSWKTSSVRWSFHVTGRVWQRARWLPCAGFPHARISRSSFLRCGRVNNVLPLAGIRVVALEQAVAAPFCSRQLCDLGADVIKVEREDGGDTARGYDAVLNGESAYFAWLNRGKRSIVLDLKERADLETCARLLARADVFVHNLAPGAVERLGFGYDALHEQHPRLVWCGISGYGPDGPQRDRKAYDLLVQAESGVIALTGTDDHPAKVGVSIADIGAGLYAYSSILAALIQRGTTQRGQRIDISMLECLVEWMTPALYVWKGSGVVPP